MQLVIASRNRDKLKEITSMFHEAPVECIPVIDVLPDFEVVEDRDTILGNAAKKAMETAKACGKLTLADDTGLFIRALNNEPGVYAARYAGENCSYKDNRDKVLALMQGKNDRSAIFQTVIVLADPEGIIAIRYGNVNGEITTEERGTQGFGYDSIFKVDETNRTYAEMSDDEKNQCSHRAYALLSLLPFLTEYVEYYNQR